MATLDDLEARVAALGANQREDSLRLDRVETRLTGVETELADFRQESRACFRSVDEQLTEIKDLIIGGRNGTQR